MKVNDVTSALKNGNQNVAESAINKADKAVENPAYVVKLEKGDNGEAGSSQNKENRWHTLVNEVNYSNTEAETDKNIAEQTINMSALADNSTNTKTVSPNNVSSKQNKATEAVNNETINNNIEDNDYTKLIDKLTQKKLNAADDENTVPQQKAVSDFTVKRHHIKFLRGQLQQISKEMQTMRNEMQDDSKEIILRNMQNEIQNIQQQINTTMAEIMNSSK